MRHRLSCTLAALVLAAGGLAACGGDEAESTATGSGGGMSVTVVEPAAGAEVQVPFTVRVDATTELGPQESGKHHVHVWFDDDEDNYTMIEADSGPITKAPSGEHTMHVSLRNANHSAAGVEATTELTITGGTPGEDAPGPYTY
ncbi:hypothetical protein WEI85_16255 [Actinomycetes bacterium KLBMP 9797]